MSQVTGVSSGGTSRSVSTSAGVGSGSSVVGTSSTGGLVRASAAATPDATPMKPSSAATIIQNQRGVPPDVTRPIRMRR